MRTLIAAAALSISLFVAAPAMAIEENPVDPEITDGTAAREFREARLRWLAEGISDYRMTVSSYCFCRGPRKVKITVRDGKMVRISARPWFGPRTIPGMFRVVGQAIKREATMLDVEYHPRFGFPRRNSIDYVALMVDEERGFRITGFKQL